MELAQIFRQTQHRVCPAAKFQWRCWLHTLHKELCRWVGGIPPPRCPPQLLPALPMWCPSSMGRRVVLQAPSWQHSPWLGSRKREDCRSCQLEESLLCLAQRQPGRSYDGSLILRISSLLYDQRIETHTDEASSETESLATTQS